LRYPREGAFSLEVDFFQRRLAELWIAAVPTASEFLDIGVPDDYGRAAAVLERLRRTT
jgi:NDP-sugar pyrophosphorylase family protein